MIDRITRYVACLACSIGLGLPPWAVVSAQPDGPDPRLFEMLRLRPGDPPWAGLFRLRAAEAAFQSPATTREDYAELRSQVAASLGLYDEAMRYHEARRSPDSGDTVAASQRLRRFRRRRPVDAILDLADTARMVMINERHHAATDRVLTLQLLRRLREKGFRYLAAEAFAPTDTALLRHGRVQDNLGYTSEPVFAALVREAVRLGFTLVSYEVRPEQRAQPDTLSMQQRRDWHQAQNLLDATVRRDPTAKVLVHAGYAHILERERPGWSPMAAYVRTLAGIDPVTVDQTSYTESLDPQMADVVMRAAAASVDDTGWVFIDEAGQYLRPPGMAVDMAVVRGAPRRIDGRPAMLVATGLREARRVRTAACRHTRCLVEVRAERDATRDAVLDRVEVHQQTTVTVFVPRARVRITVRRSDGSRLRTWLQDYSGAP